MSIFTRVKNLTGGLFLMTVGVFLSGQSCGMTCMDATKNGFELFLSAFAGRVVRLE